MKYVVIIFALTALTSLSTALLAESSIPVQSYESSSKKPDTDKTPHSLFAQDPNDSRSMLADSNPADDYIDPYDVDNGGVEGDGYVDPYDVRPKLFRKPKPPVTQPPSAMPPMQKKYVPPAEQQQSRPAQKPDETFQSPQSPSLDLSIPAETSKEPAKPSAFSEWENPLKKWWSRPGEDRPEVDPKDLGIQLGFSYVGAFSGSVLGLFGGFIVGNIYQEVASCGRCWLDIAVGGSVLGAGLAASSGSYYFGNNDNQIASWKATLAGGLLPIALVEGFMGDNKPVSKSISYMVLMPLGATLGYHMTRRKRAEGERDFFELLFYGDTWVSANPETKTVALNMNYRF